MSTATQPAAHAAPKGDEQPKPFDPDHDIDTRRTITWLVVWMVILFASLWLMVELYGAVIDRERVKKIDLQPAAEVLDLRARESSELTRSEDLGGGNQRVDIETAMKVLVKRAQK